MVDHLAIFKDCKRVTVYSDSVDSVDSVDSSPAVSLIHDDINKC